MKILRKMSVPQTYLTPLPNFLHDEVTASLKRNYKKKKRDRNKTRMKSAVDELDPASQARKRKRTASSKLKASAVADYIPLKRPRGRPPLNLPLTGAIPGNFVPVRPTIKPNFRRSDAAPAALSNQQHAPPKSLKVSTDPVETDVAKTQRPHSALVTQRILSRLMTEGPLGVADFLSTGADAPPRDLVQSILDILQVTAVVVQLKLKDPKSMQSSSSSGSVTATNSVVYAMAGIAKGPEYTELCKISEVTRKKIANIAATRKRIERLQVRTIR